VSIPEWRSEAAASPAADPVPERAAEPRPRGGPGFLGSELSRRRLAGRALGIPEERIAAVSVRSGRERFGRVTASLAVDLDGGERRRLVAKYYGGLRGAALGADAHRVCDALRAAGMAPPATATVPAVHGYFPGERLLVMEHAPGRSWLDRLVASAGSDTPEAACRRAADWLLALHRIEADARLRPPGALRHLIRVLESRSVGGASGAGGPGGSAASAVAGHCRELAERLPGLAVRLAPWPHRLVPSLRAAGAETLAPSHGDFHPGNLLLSDDPPGRATAVDLDGVALREPAFDVGSGVAQLLAMSDLQEWPGGALAGARTGVGAGARAATELWARYRERLSPHARGRLEERAVLHAFAGLIGVLHYSFRMETRRRDLGERWLPALEAWWEVRREGLAAGVARFAETLS
jgi:hypothetical protein